MNSTETKSTNHKSSKLPLWIGSIIILVFSAISFIFLPALVQGAGKTGAYKPFGYYKNQPIEYTQGSLFTTMMSYRLQEAEKNGEVLDNSKYYKVLEEAFGDTITRMAFSEKVAKSGYIVPDSAINRILRQYFLDENGNYSAKLYNSTSDNTKVTLRKQVEEDLIYQQYFSDFFNATMQKNALFGLKSSANESSFIYDMHLPEKTFEYAAFALHDFPDSEIKAYGNQHADLFQRINMSVITVSSKAEAEKIKNRIAGGEITFEDAVSEYSNKNYSDSNGVLSNKYAYQLKSTVASDESFHALLIQGTTELSDVIQTGSFFSIFKVNASPANADLSDKSVLDNIFSYIAENDAGTVEDYFTTYAQDFSSVASVSSFDTACEKFGIEKGTTPSFALNYNNNPILMSNYPTSSKEIAAGYANENFLKTAFSLKLNEVSSPVLIGNYVVVLKLIDEKTTDEPDTGMGEYYTQLYYPYYTSVFDQSSAETAILAKDYVKDNVLSVFLEDMLAGK